MVLANLRRGLLAHSEGLIWIEAAKVANLTPHAMRQWGKHPNADNLISTAINYHLEEALGTIAAAAPTLAKRLVDIGLSSSTRPYTAVDAIKTSLTFLQSGVIDRENKSEIKKIRRALEQLKENLLK